MRDLTWITEDFIAHRGLHTLDKTVPENTLLSFQKAIEKGYAIEFDINVMKDGTVVCFHDSDFRRLCNVDKKLSELTYDEISEFRILNSEEHIPSLKEVLDFVNGRVPLLIELKPYGDKHLLCRQFMEVMKGYSGVWSMQSFHPMIVYWFRKNHPDVIRGQIAEYFKDDPKMKKITKYLLKSMLLNFITKPDFINYGLKDMPNKYIDRQMRRGMTVITYASQSQEQFDMVKKHYYNSVFEYFIPRLKK